MEQQTLEQQMLPEAGSPAYYRRDLLKKEAYRLIGDINGLLAKTDADVAVIGSNPKYVGHASDSRVWGQTLRAAYANYRNQASSLKDMIVEELGIENDYSHHAPFEESTSEFYSENSNRVREGLEKLKQLAVQVDPTPVIIGWNTY